MTKSALSALIVNLAFDWLMRLNPLNRILNAPLSVLMNIERGAPLKTGSFEAKKERKSCSNISSGTRGDSDVDCGDPDGLPPLPCGVSIHCNIPTGANGVIFIGNLWKILNISSDLEASAETFIPPCHSCPLRLP